MTRRPSPRPTFDQAAAIPYDEAVLHLWGDPEAGYVGDRIYVSSDLIHLIEFSLLPRARFTHSDGNRTGFAADEVLHVVEGEMLLVNPETGEAEVARPGESVFFRRDTWHHAINRSPDRPLRIMELFAPPPSTGASSSYACTRPYLSEWGPPTFPNLLTTPTKVEHGGGSRRNCARNRRRRNQDRGGSGGLRGQGQLAPDGADRPTRWRIPPEVGPGGGSGYHHCR